MFNDDKDPVATPPAPDAVERITYDAVCTCDDTYGDNPWCPACFPLTDARGDLNEVDQQTSAPDAVLAAPVDQAVRLPQVPAHPVPVGRCGEHGKVLPHYRCEESERWLDDLAARTPGSSS